MYFLYDEFTCIAFISISSIVLTAISFVLFSYIAILIFTPFQDLVHGVLCTYLIINDEANIFCTISFTFSILLIFSRFALAAYYKIFLHPLHPNELEYIIEMPSLETIIQKKSADEGTIGGRNIDITDEDFPVIKKRSQSESELFKELYNGLETLETFPSSPHPSEKHYEPTYITTQLKEKHYEPTYITADLKEHTLPPPRITYDNLLDSEDIELDLNIVIGKGGFGNVYLGQFQGSACAFKSAEELQNYDSSEKILFKETSDSPCVCRYYGICLVDSSKYFLVMEYFEDGNLLKFIRHNHLHDLEKVHYCMNIVRGLRHLHSKDVLHGDLACRNILVDIKKKRAVITDFGHSRRSPCTKKLHTFAYRWASPDLNETAKSSYESDIWSLGVCFWEIFSDGKVPYEGKSKKEVQRGLLERTLKPECDETWPLVGVLNWIFSDAMKGDDGATDVFKMVQKFHDPGESRFENSLWFDSTF